MALADSVLVRESHSTAKHNGSCSTLLLLLFFKETVKTNSLSDNAFFFFLFFLPVTDIYIIQEFGKFWVTESFQKRKNKVLVISFRKICTGKKTAQQAICSYLKVDRVGQRPRCPYLTLSKKLSNSLNLPVGCRSVLLLGQHWSRGAHRSKAPRTPHPSDTELWPRGWCGRKI